jgi:lysophospholipase L1-like esterase
MKKIYDPDDAFDQMYENLQQDHPEISLISDIWEGVFENYENMYDEVHPNENGYKIIAEIIFRAIAPLLVENQLLRGAMQ